MEKQGATGIGQALDKLPFSKLKMLDNALDNKGFTIGRISVLSDFPEEMGKVTKLISSWIFLKKKNRQEEICRQIADIVEDKAA